jgi:hypothetical protein
VLSLGHLLAVVTAASGGDSTALVLAVDSSRHEIVIRIGPFAVPAMAMAELSGMQPDMGMTGHDAMAQDSPLFRFDWPVDGWARGFRVALVDRQRRPLPRHLLHHMLLVNFDRRQLLYPMLERLLGVGAETDDVTLPRTIGIPVRHGMVMGIYVGWHNDSMEPLEGVSLELTVQWLPTNQNPPPVSVLPLYMDANLTVGVSNAFDVPPGHLEKSWSFTMPVSGRLLGVGGHLHDYGSAVRLEEPARGRTLITLQARRDSSGRVDGLRRKLFGVRGEGLKLSAGHTYRVVGVYDNPTGVLRRNAAMAHMVGLFVPEDLARWPAVDWSDPVIQRDLAGLGMEGRMQE